MIRYVCGHGPGVIISLALTTGDESQLSFEIAIPVLAGNVLDEQVMVIFGGQLITGTTLSITVMTWLQVFVLPQASVDFQVRVIV